MKNLPFVSIVIANYNGQAYLPTCLSSVLKTVYPTFEVLIIDDGSTDNSREVIRSYIKRDNRIQLLINLSNLGAAASRNKAAEKAKGAIIIFLDNDTEVTSSWMIEMVKVLLKSDDIGACQALLVDFDKRDVIQLAGVYLWAATGWGLPIHQGEKLKIIKIDENLEIVALSAAMGIKKDVFNRIKGFDEQEAVVTEDLDLSWRVWISGFRIVLASSSVVYHKTKNISERQNMKHSSQKIYFHLTKNSLMSIIKNYEFSNVLKFSLFSFCISLSRGIFILFKKKDTASIAGSTKAFFWILRNILTIKKNRKFVQQNRVYTDKQLFGRIIIRENPRVIYNQYYRK